jgi:hypothetical protein
MRPQLAFDHLVLAASADDFSVQKNGSAEALPFNWARLPGCAV